MPELDGFITCMELVDGDQIIICALGGHAANWTDHNVVVGTGNWQLPWFQLHYPANQFRFKVLDRVPVPVMCTCGRVVSGAMMAIGARHLCQPGT